MKPAQIIFTVNPGATSTKCAFYQIIKDEIKEIVTKTIEHSDKTINQFENVSAQVDYREELVRQFITKNLPENSDIIACAGRGGMLSPVPSGVIKVNKELVDFSLKTPVYQHASNLGAPLAYRVSQTYKVDAFIVDPVSVDEFTPVSRISGCPDFPRFSFVHALNIRATIHRLSKELNKDFNKMKCVAAHLGAGFSIAAFSMGKIIDNDNRMESASFTPERAGGIPPIPLINACFSGKYTKSELMKKLYGEAGMFAYLGTKDVREVLSQIQKKDKHSEIVYNAMIYQICKQIGSMASVLDFDLDGIIITGGLVHSEKLINDINTKVHRIGKVYAYPGSNENRALASSILRIINGQDKFMTWPVKINIEE